MPVFLMLLLTILPELLKWLLDLINKKQELPPRVKKKLAEALPLMAQVRVAAIRLGCEPEYKTISGLKAFKRNK